MRGFPPIHLILCCIGFILFAIPLARLTFLRPASSASVYAAPVQPGVTAEQCFIRVRFAHKPTQLSLKLDGKELIADFKPDALSPIEVHASMPIPKTGIELLLAATWPAGTPDTALTVELEPDKLDAKAQTAWSSGGQANQVLTFSW